MTTAIIGAGHIGSAQAANLVRDGEDVVLASRRLKQELLARYDDPRGEKIIARGGAR